MNNHTPVKIPKLPGKIFLDRLDTGVYVKYLLGREYDRDRGFCVPKYKMIGVLLTQFKSAISEYRYVKM